MTLAPSLTDPDKYYAFNNDGTETELHVISRTPKSITLDSKVNHNTFIIGESYIDEYTLNCCIYRDLKHIRNNFKNTSPKDKEYINRLLQLIREKCQDE